MDELVFGRCGDLEMNRLMVAVTQTRFLMDILNPAWVVAENEVQHGIDTMWISSCREEDKLGHVQGVQGVENSSSASVQ